MVPSSSDHRICPLSEELPGLLPHLIAQEVQEVQEAWARRRQEVDSYRDKQLGMVYRQVSR